MSKTKTVLATLRWEQRRYAGPAFADKMKATLDGALSTPVTPRKGRRRRFRSATRD